MNKLVVRLGSLNMVKQTVKEKENSDSKPVNLPLKIILCDILLTQRG